MSRVCAYNHRLGCVLLPREVLLDAAFVAPPLLGESGYCSFFMVCATLAGTLDDSQSDSVALQRLPSNVSSVWSARRLQVWTLRSLVAQSLIYRCFDRHCLPRTTILFADEGHHD